MDATISDIEAGAELPQVMGVHQLMVDALPQLKTYRQKVIFWMGRTRRNPNKMLPPSDGALD